LIVQVYKYTIHFFIYLEINLKQYVLYSPHIFLKLLEYIVNFYFESNISATNLAYHLK